MEMFEVLSGQQVTSSFLAERDELLVSVAGNCSPSQHLGEQFPHRKLQSRASPPSVARSSSVYLWQAGI